MTRVVKAAVEIPAEAAEAEVEAVEVEAVEVEAVEVEVEVNFPQYR